MNSTTSDRHFVEAIQIQGREPADVPTMDTLIKAKTCTHVRARNGKIYRLFSGLNRKSVSLNNGGSGPQRLTWPQVESFGYFAEVDR